MKSAEYLHLITFNSRKILTKFRISAHNLEVELGRYKNIPREQRHCNKCKVLDDEKHFFLDCQINDSLRTNFLNSLSQKCENFSQLDSIEKLIFILNPNVDVSPSIVDFIKQSLELRK